MDIREGNRAPVRAWWNGDRFWIGSDPQPAWPVTPGDGQSFAEAFAETLATAGITREDLALDAYAEHRLRKALGEA